MESRLRQLQTIELEILKDINTFCRENDITFYLGEGTLLGGIRHQGFIPWDDDVDILMPRNDYERFLELAPNYLKQKYEIQHATTVARYWSPFIKVRSLDNSEFKQEHISHLTTHNGPYIDIFPLDNVPRRKSISLKINSFRIRFLRRSLSLKLGLKKPNHLKSYIMFYMSKTMKVSAILKKLNRLFQKFNKSGNLYTVNWGSYYKHEKQIFPNDYYGSPCYIPFENIELPVPREAEKILTSIYGNYLELPSEEKRRIKHHFNI